MGIVQFEASAKELAPMTVVGGDTRDWLVSKLPRKAKGGTSIGNGKACKCFNKLIRRQDDVIKWKHFPRYWPFVRGIHRSPVNSPHKGQWRGALMCSLICVNKRLNNREAGDLRRHRAYNDVIVMKKCTMCLSDLFVLGTSQRLVSPPGDIYSSDDIVSNATRVKIIIQIQISLKFVPDGFSRH